MNRTFKFKIGSTSEPQSTPPYVQINLVEAQPTPNIPPSSMSVFVPAGPDTEDMELGATFTVTLQSDPDKV